MADTFATFPYAWSSWEDWLARVEYQVLQTRARGFTNIYAYELWNEPNWTWDEERAGPFDVAWARTASVVRSLDDKTPILGPSIDRWDPDWMRRFLVASAAAGSIPDIISWHELDPADADIVRHVGEFRALESDLGIGRRPVSINEYGAHRDMAVPGRLATLVARLERAEVDTANLAFWHKPGRLADLVTGSGRPTGAWWVYKWYGEMAGSMLATVPADSTAAADAFASRDPETGEIRVVVGGGRGDVRVAVDGLASSRDLWSPRVVEVWSAPWTGTDGPLEAPYLQFQADVEVHSGRASVVLPDVDPTTAHLLVFSRRTSRSTSHGPRYEAEAGAITGGEIVASPLASGGRYVHGLTLSQGQARLGVRVAEAGPYLVAIRYRFREASIGELRIDVNGESVVPVSICKTRAAAFATAATTVLLPLGESWLAVSTTNGRLDLDYVDVARWRTRIEAEDGRIARGSVHLVDMRPSAFESNTFSSDAYVAGLTEIESAVEFGADVPANGVYEITIGYASREGVSRHTVTVDGDAVAVVEYSPTQGRELVGTVSLRLRLMAGRRRIALTKGRNPGDVALDFVDIEYAGP